MYRGIKLNKKEWEITSVVSISGEGGSRLVSLESDNKLTYTKGSILDVIIPKEIDFIEFENDIAIIVHLDGFNFTIPCITASVNTKSFVFSLEKKKDIKIWKMLHCVKEPLKKLEFIRID